MVVLIVLCLGVEMFVLLAGVKRTIYLVVEDSIFMVYLYENCNHTSITNI